MRKNQSILLSKKPHQFTKRIQRQFTKKDNREEERNYKTIKVNKMVIATLNVNDLNFPIK